MTFPMIIPLCALIIAFLILVTYFETMEKTPFYKSMVQDKKEFKFRSIKGFSIRYWLLIGINSFTYGVFWSFYPMMMRVLELVCGLKYADSTDLTIWIPILQMCLIFVVMVLSKMTDNESYFMLAGSFLCFL